MANSILEAGIIRSYCDILTVHIFRFNLRHESRRVFYGDISTLIGTKSYIGIMNSDAVLVSSGRTALSFFQLSFAFGGAYVLCHHTLRTTEP